MKYRLLYLAMAVCATLATSCSDDELPGDNNGTNDANAIQFGVTSIVVEARTVYGDPGTSVNWPLYWKANDQIHIYCPDAEDITDAGYVVAPKNGSTTTHEGTISPLTENVYLKWSGDSNPHDFYAAYPYGKATAVELAEDKSTAYITFAVNNNQTCTINTTPTDGNYVAEPDMTNAYMVAHNLDVKPSVDAVSLDFKPIMTTLVVKVTAPEWALNTSKRATITGISVITEVDSEDANKGQFVYDVVNKSIVSNPTGNKTSHSTFVGVKHGENNFIDLGSNQTLTMTVFLPPIPINNNNPVQVKLHVAGSDFVAHLGETTPATKPTNHIYANVTIEPSQIRRVNLPTLPDPLPTTSAWLTLLDDDIYVSQLSIPGAHDACTSGVESLIGAGQTQLLTMSEQLNIGIRAFDIRPALDRTGNLLSGYTYYLNDICHGGYGTGIKLDNVMTMINDYLIVNPDEFVILIFRNETGDAHGGGALIGDKELWVTESGEHESEYISLLQSFLKTNEIYISRMKAFKPDLTIGECRGKILLLSRNNLSPSIDYETAYTGWNHDNHTNTINTVTGTGGSCDIYIQDMFSPGENGNSSASDYLTKKEELIKARLDQSATFHTGDYTPKWMINHCSGYTGTNNYCNNAATINPKIYEYIVGSDKSVGSTGIMMLDFIGKRSTTYVGQTYQVYGDLLPQTIIDNNYKYIMKRKTTE